MAQSVELLLDPALDAAVRGEWQALAAAGLPSLAGHTAPSHRPHVTLAVAHDPWPEDVEAAVAEAASVVELPAPVTLGGLVVFGGGRGRHVLARLVVPSAELLALQATIAAAAGPGVPHTAPGTWTPHVTLCRALPAASFPAALAALDARELTGSGTAIRRWDGAQRREWPLAQA